MSKKLWISGVYATYLRSRILLECPRGLQAAKIMTESFLYVNVSFSLFSVIKSFFEKLMLSIEIQSFFFFLYLVLSWLGHTAFPVLFCFFFKLLGFVSAHYVKSTRSNSSLILKVFSGDRYTHQPPLTCVLTSRLTDWYVGLSVWVTHRSLIPACSQRVPQCSPRSPPASLPWPLCWWAWLVSCSTQ